MIRAFGKDEDISKLFKLINCWLEESNPEEFGFEADSTEYIDEIYELVHGDTSDLLVMEIAGEIKGLMGIAAHKSPIGKQMVADAHYWYTLPEHRGKGISFIHPARLWARENNCTHLMFTASRMAGELYDKVCNLYERIGMEKFETTYIEEIEK